MELRLEQGDYVPNGAGGFQRLEGAEALLQRVLFRLPARRGQFPFLPELAAACTSWAGKSPPPGRPWPSSMSLRPWCRNLTWR